jgi:hypothetical protein
MKTSELKRVLRQNPKAQPRFILPDGDVVPAHYHVTEVGYVTKRFIDCGGTLHQRSESCLLQIHVADDVEHRLDAGTFARILDLGRQVLPHDQMEVEVEYEDCAISQYPIDTATIAGDVLEIRFREKHTDCLAKAKCGIESGNGSACC